MRTWQVCWHKCAKLLEKLPLHEGVEPGLMGAMSLALQRVVFVAGDYIVREGAVGTDMYLIAAGEVQVVTGPPDNHIEITRLRDGAFFGEMALLEEAERHMASVRVTSFCDGFCMSKAAYQALVKDYPSVKTYLEDVARLRLVASLEAHEEGSGGEGKGEGCTPEWHNLTLRALVSLIKSSGHAMAPIHKGVQRPTSRQNSVRLARVISVMQAFRSSRSRSPSREVPRPARVLLAKQRARCTAVVRLTRTLTDQEPGEGEGKEGGRTPPLNRHLSFPCRAVSRARSMVNRGMASVAPAPPEGRRLSAGERGGRKPPDEFRQSALAAAALIGMRHASEVEEEVRRPVEGGGDGEGGGGVKRHGVNNVTFDCGREDATGAWNRTRNKMRSVEEGRAEGEAEGRNGEEGAEDQLSWGQGERARSEENMADASRNRVAFTESYSCEQ
ncbi:MAG: hypothetical protein SGPRY_011283 [Prymnesium sp.]